MYYVINGKNIFAWLVIGIIMGSPFLKHDYGSNTLLKTPTSFSHGCLVCYENNKLYCKKYLYYDYVGLNKNLDLAKVIVAH
jgi:hypothetical protein